MFSRLHSFRKLTTVVVVVALLCLDCLSPLLTATPARADFSVGEERQVGEELLAIVRKEFKVIDDPDVVQYINRVGGEILRVAGPQFFNYHFFVIDNKEFNAFAAPSGLIFIHSGLIKTMDTEGELLSVIGHEVGHAASRHVAEQMAKSTKINATSAAAALASILIGAGPVSEALLTGSLAAGTTMNLKFSREEEEEADRLGYQYLKAMGRNPADMVDMLQKMYRIDRYRQGQVPSYLLSHPEPARRMGYIQDLLLHETKSVHYPPEDEFAFRRIKCRILSISEEPQALLPIYQRQLAKSDNDPDLRAMAYYGISLVQLANADFSGATASLDKVLAHYPHRLILTTDMGAIRYEAGQYDEALRLFQTAHDADPDDDYTKYNLARTLAHQGRQQEAQRFYEQLVEEMPDNADLHYQLGQLEAAMGDTGGGYYHLGAYHWYGGGDAKMARRYLNQAIQQLSEGRAEKKAARDLLALIGRVEKNR